MAENGGIKNQQKVVGKEHNVLPSSHTGLIPSCIFRGCFQTSTGAGKNPQILVFQMKTKNYSSIFTGYFMNERAEQIAHEF